ncbi:MAG: tetratricopeptide repeat protein, partial [Candidatus Hodarchaeales archaeon]
GRIYKLQGKYDEAIQSLERGLKIVKETIVGANMGMWVSYVLFYLILVAQDLQSLELAEEYQKQMHDLKETSKSKFVHLRIQFSEAIVLKMSKRMAQKFQAQQKFQTILENEIIDHNITVLSMLNLCELLILEIKYSESAEKLLQEVIQLAEQLQKIGQSQKSSSMIIMALLLRTKLALVQGDVETASHLLSNREKTCQSVEASQDGTRNSPRRIRQVERIDTTKGLNSRTNRACTNCHLVGGGKENSRDLGKSRFRNSKSVNNSFLEKQSILTEDLFETASENMDSRTKLC